MIYLDNAATTFPKPRGVTAEVQRCLTQYCGNPGRGAHPLALAAAEQIFACRLLLSDFLGLGAPERILFTGNTTHALNLLLKGFLRRGDHILISELEHNAVRRPLCRLQRARGVRFDTFPVVGKTTEEILAGIAAAIRPETVAVLCTHACNICSLTLPLSEIGIFCRQRGLRFFVDAAQSAGVLPIDMRGMQIDALAAPGHKSLYGIQGIGVLALGEGLELTTLLEGGSGADSFAEEMPVLPPERYEAGTLPTPAIVGLLEGVRFVQERSVHEIAAHERALFCATRERLEGIKGVQIYQREAEGAVLLFNREDISAAQVAHALGKDGICVRAGYHCAPMAHEALGTPEGGAVRISFGALNTLSDVDALWRALRQMA